MKSTLKICLVTTVCSFLMGCSSLAPMPTQNTKPTITPEPTQTPHLKESFTPTPIQVTTPIPAPTITLINVDMEKYDQFYWLRTVNDLPTQIIKHKSLETNNTWFQIGSLHKIECLRVNNRTETSIVIDNTLLTTEVGNLYNIFFTDTEDIRLSDGIMFLPHLCEVVSLETTKTDKGNLTFEPYASLRITVSEGGKVAIYDPLNSFIKQNGKDWCYNIAKIFGHKVFGYSDPTNTQYMWNPNDENPRMCTTVNMSEY